MELYEIIQEKLGSAEIHPHSVQSVAELEDKLLKFKSELIQEITVRTGCEDKDLKLVIDRKEEGELTRYRITLYLLSKKLQKIYKGQNGATIEFAVG